MPVHLGASVLAHVRACELAILRCASCMLAKTCFTHFLPTSTSQNNYGMRDGTVKTLNSLYVQR
eukprot:6207921-Pleurochrysis_carterae.AAC.4